MNKKRILQMIAMVLLLSMMFSTVAFALPPGQEKIPAGQAKKLIKYEEAFKLMKTKGIMLGNGSGDYRLNDFVKRGDITVMIVRAFKLNLEKIDDVNDKDDFLDLIDKNNYQYNFVKIAKHYNIAQGDGNKFYPDKFVTYEEAIALIERAVKVANSNVTVLNEKDEAVKLRNWYKEEFTKEGDFRNFLIEMLFDEDKLSEKEIKQKLGEPATRGDIASMLYYVLTGKEDFDEEEKESDIIEKEIKENTSLKFDILNFGFLKDYDGDQVKFASPKYGKLTIDEEELRNRKYDIKSIDDITFTPEVDFTGEVEIKYNVYKDDTIVYNGVINITVIEVYEIKVIEIKDYDGEKIDFVGELDKVADDAYDEDDKILDLVDYVMFKLPKSTLGKLLIKYDGNTDNEDDEEFVPVLENKRYDLDEIEWLKYEPNNDKNYDIIILFSAYDRKPNPDKKYDGAINIVK